MAARKIACTVTNDLNYDQRMIRICTSLANAGYEVTLIGFRRKNSKPLNQHPFRQVRLPIVAEHGKIMYLYYWIRLFFYLIKNRHDVICAIDLDTIIPVYYASKIRGTKRMYDAHEIFTELKEVICRPVVYKMWSWIGKHFVPKFSNGYTIGDSYAEHFKKLYGVQYSVVRNATVLKPLSIPVKKDRTILYQGWVNVGRCFEQLIPAMKNVEATLIVCGEGNFYLQAQDLVKQHNLEHKIIFKGYVPPAQLIDYTAKAYIGITLFEDTSLSNRLSLANRFFDYMHSGVPQLCNAYPEYEKINETFEVACLLPQLSSDAISYALNRMLDDDAYYKRLQQNCLQAREKYCWQEEEKKLLAVYNSL